MNKLIKTENILSYLKEYEKESKERISVQMFLLILTGILSAH